MSFAMKWDPVYGQINPELLKRDSYGGALGQFGTALNAVADNYRQDQTNAALMGITQLNTNRDAVAEKANILNQFESQGQAIDQKAVLDALMARTDTLGKQEAGNLVNDLRLNQITDNAVVSQRANESGLGSQYLGPLADLMASNTASKLAAERQAHLDKLSDAKTASEVAYTNAQIKEIDTRIADTIAKNPDKESSEYVYDEKGNQVFTRKVTPGTGSILNQFAGGGGGKPINLSKEQQSNMDTTWKALKANGVSDTAATFLLGEIGREGSFANANIFGNHSDPKAGRTNSGIISWSDPARRKGFLDEMTKGGHMNPNGTMKQTPEALSAQVSYMVKEMKANYPDAYKALQRNDLTDQEADKIFGGGYIGWSRKDPEFSAKGYQNRADFTNTASSRYGSGGGNSASGGTKSTTGTTDNPFADGTTPAQQKGISFTGASVDTARAKLVATRDAQNAKNVIGGMKSTLAEDQKYNDFLKTNNYTGTHTGTILNDNVEIYNAMIGPTNSNLWRTLSNAEKQEVLAHVSERNKADSGFLGANVSYNSMINIARNYVNTKRKTEADAQRQAMFSQFTALASELYNANKKTSPNITMDMAMETLDKDMYKEYIKARKAQESKQTFTANNRKK